MHTLAENPSLTYGKDSIVLVVDIAFQQFGDSILVVGRHVEVGDACGNEAAVAFGEMNGTVEKIRHDVFPKAMSAANGNVTVAGNAGVDYKGIVLEQFAMERSVGLQEFDGEERRIDEHDRFVPLAGVVCPVIVMDGIVDGVACFPDVKLTQFAVQTGAVIVENAVCNVVTLCCISASKTPPQIAWMRPAGM